MSDLKAIVTEIEGTTRDVLEESLEIDGLKVRIMDTAGVSTMYANDGGIVISL